MIALIISTQHREKYYRLFSLCNGENDNLESRQKNTNIENKNSKFLDNKTTLTDFILFDTIMKLCFPTISTTNTPLFHTV